MRTKECVCGVAVLLLLSCAHRAGAADDIAGRRESRDARPAMERDFDRDTVSDRADHRTEIMEEIREDAAARREMKDVIASGGDNRLHAESPNELSERIEIDRDRYDPKS